MIDLTSEYLGLKLKNPLVVSSTPLSDSIANVRRMEESGASAIVLTSLFEEQLDMESRALDSDLSRGTDSFAESLSYLPDYDDYHTSQDGYLKHVQQVKETVSIPVIGSINGATPGGWVKFAREVESAGADALELNTYSLAIDPNISGEKVEEQLLDLVSKVRQSIKIPLAVKLSPQFTSIPHLARRLDAAGAGSLVLFNRFYQPDFDIETMTVVPRLNFSFSDELLLRLHWVAILYGHLRADLAITGGVHTAEDVVKGVMAGASVTMMASALHLRGIEHLKTMQNDLIHWMEEHEFTSLRQMRGALSRQAVPDSSPFERGNYIKTLSAYTLRQPALH
jgi:dihydroorotate dehydrogenase (fumarate)